VAVLILVLLATPVLAHVPSFPVDNTTPERAVAIPDGVKSWAFYDELGPGEARYYRVSLSVDERLQVGTFTPRTDGFTPSLVLMSPSLNGTDRVPPWVTVPKGMGAVAVEGERPERATYEPFAPSATYQTASITRAVETETTYLVAVYEPGNRSGPAGVAVGYAEEFSLAEYVTVPFDLVRTYLWAGQHPFVAIGPFLFTALLGTGLVRKRHGGPGTRSLVQLTLLSAGFVILGSGVNTLVQMGIALSRTGPTGAALVTAVFVVVPIICGGWVVRLSLREHFTLPVGTRIGLVAVGGMTLLTWAGFVVGPALVLMVAITPKRFSKD